MSTFYNPRPQFLDSNGNPLSAGRLTFYEVGTTTQKEVYTDTALSIAAQNPQPLDSGGFPDDGTLYLNGAYKLLIEASDGGGGYVEEYTVPSFGGDTGSGGSTSTFVNTISDLRQLTGNDSDNTFVLGYTSIGDTGGGLFRWDATSSEADDGGIYIQPVGAPAFGRWVRVLDGNVVIPAYWGATPSLGAPVSANLDNMIDWVELNPQYSIVVPNGSYELDSSIEFVAGIFLTIQDGASFVADEAQTVTISCFADMNTNYFVCRGVNNTTLIYQPSSAVQTFVKPRWFGATGNALADDYQAFADLLASSNSYPVIIDDSFLIDTDIDIDRVLSFESGGYILVGGNGFITIQVDYNNNSADYIWSGDLEYLRLDVERVFETREFNIKSGVNLSNVNYQAMVICITNDGTREAVLRWYGEYNITTYLDATYDYMITHRMDSSLLSFDADFVFRKIDAPPVKIFEPGGTGHAQIKSDAYLQWWGITNGLMSEDAIKDAYNATNEGTGWLDGYGAEFALSGSIALGANSGSLRIRNCTISRNGSAPITYVIQVQAGLELEDVRLIDSSATIGQFFYAPSNGGDNATLRMINCTALTESNLYTGEDVGGDFKVSGCDFDYNTQSAIVAFETAAKQVEITGSRFNQSISTTRVASQLIRVETATPDSIIVSNNVFDGVAIFVDDSRNCTISDNYCADGQLHVANCVNTSITGNKLERRGAVISNIILGGSGAHVNLALIIKNNTFYNQVSEGGSASDDLIQLNGSHASVGHTVEMLDNGLNGVGQVYKSEYVITDSIAASALTADATDANWRYGTSTFDLTGKYILPSSLTPKRIEISINRATGSSAQGLKVVQLSALTTLPNVAITYNWWGPDTGLSATYSVKFIISEV